MLIKKVYDKDSGELDHYDPPDPLNKWKNDEYKNKIHYKAWYTSDQEVFIDEVIKKKDAVADTNGIGYYHI